MRSIVFALMMIFGLMSGGLSVAAQEATPAASPASSSPPVAPGESLPIGVEVPRDGKTVGYPNAPVKIDKWVDLQCSACLGFARYYDAPLIADYVNTGKVLLTIHFMTFGGAESEAAAEAAECSADQGLFWDFYPVLVANNQGENVGSFTDARLLEMANIAGLDIAEFTECVQSDRHIQQIKDDIDDASALGIQAVPAFIFGEEVHYFQGWESLTQLIDSKVEEAAAAGTPVAIPATPDATPGTG